MASAGSIFIDLLLNDAQFREKIKKARGSTKSFGDDLTKLGKIAASAFAATTVALGALVVRQMHVIDATSKMARQMGIAVESFQALSLVADEAGIGQEKLATLITKSQKAIFAAAQSGSDAFRRLGLDAQALIKLSPDKQFEAIAESISKISNPTARAALAMQVFGKSGTDVILMLDDLGGKLEEAREFNRKFGIEINEIDAAKIEAANDAFGRIGKAIGGVGNTIAVQLSPLVIALSQDFLNIIPAAKSWADFTIKAAEGVMFVLDKVAIVLKTITTVLGGVGAATYLFLKDDYRGAAEAVSATFDELGKERDDFYSGFSKVSQYVEKAQTDAETAAKKAVAVQEAMRKAQGGTGMGVDPNSWAAGVTEGLRKTKDQLENFSKFSEGIISKTFEGITDAFVEFGKTGKLSFKSLADSIISDLIRLQVQATITLPLFKAFSGSGAASGLSSLFGGGGSMFAGLFADGGVIPAGKWGIAGEAGPEVIVGGASGATVIPAGRGGGMTVNVVNQSTQGLDIKPRMSQDGQTVDIIIKNAVAGAISNGSLDQVLRRRYGMTPALTTK